MARGPYLPDVDSMIAAGLDPKTGIPLKLSDLSNIDESVKRIVRVVDEQNAVNRFKWENLPKGLNGQLIERMLYYRGQIAFFYMPEQDQFYCLPYGTVGRRDVYGRWKQITPLTFMGGTKEGELEEPFITGMYKTVVHDIVLPEDLEEKTFNDGAVLLWDYTPQLATRIIPRQELNDPLCKLESEMMAFLRTALLNSTGVEGLRVEPGAEQQAFFASKAIDNAAKSGQKFVPVVGNIDFQELTGGQVAKTEEYLMAMQGIDNFRLATYGLENGGLFEKKAHMLQAEASMNDSSTSMVLQDALENRKRFCDIVNSIWGLGVEVYDAQAQLMLENTQDMINGQQEEGGQDDNSGIDSYSDDSV